MWDFKRFETVALYFVRSVMGELRMHVSAMHVPIDGAARAQARAAATAAHYVKDLVTPPCALMNHRDRSKYLFRPFNLYATY